jgi:cysteine desulfurase
MKKKKKIVYLDNAATTPILPEVKWLMQRALYLHGNASSMHDAGRRAKAAVEQARFAVAKLIGAQPQEIIFTSGGSEGNNTVFYTMLDLLRQGGSRREVIVSQIEHPSVLEMARMLEDLGYKVFYLPVDASGAVKISELKKVLSDKTLLVSVMLANNEIGTVQSVVKITTLAHKVGALVHTDAVQAVGKIPVNVRKLGVDYLTISAHKIGGPKGVGALYVRSDAPLTPLIRGGHQENNRRAGTENVLGLIGFGAAAKFTQKNLSKSIKKVFNNRERLRLGILQKIDNVRINGDIKNGLPGLLNVSFAGVEGESLLLALDAVGIAVSTGSACATSDITPSHVLMAIEADPELAHGSIRFSLGHDTTAADINYVLQELPPIVARLRQMSSAGVKND